MQNFLLILTILLQLVAKPAIEAVSLGRLGELTRDQLISLDREVSSYYDETYAELDGRAPATPDAYDQELFRSIKSTRHTIVSNHFDFRYTHNETKWLSMGLKVDANACRHQLELLVRMARKARDEPDQVPLSVSNFLDASGSTGSGVLNGNFVWLGSHSSCVRAKIPASIWRRYLGEDSGVLERSPRHRSTIDGRYCVAHLRAKAWPKWDPHFEDRITIKQAVCLPEACHSALIDQDDELKPMVDFLARCNLALPFNGDRYETSDVYCLPDEDSQWRRMDLGAKLFLVFAACWISVTIFANVMYHKRPSKTNSNVHPQTSDKNSSSGESAIKLDNSATGDEALDGQLGDNCKDEILTKTGRESNDPCPAELDVLRAFSLEVNLGYLFRPRAKKPKPDTSGSNDLVNQDSEAITRRSSQLASVAKRSSSSNEALIKNLKQAPSKTGQNQVYIVSSGCEQKPGEQEQRRSSGRVNIDVLDGLKVIATSWIVTGHTLMFFFGFTTDLRFGSERMLDVTMTTSINTLQVVGLFYIITGCLLTYFAFTRTPKRQLVKPSFWLLVLVGRYLRLIPAYALVFWFARHVAPHTGSGRGWLDYRTDVEHARGACAQESWWIMWTMSAADIKIPMDCVPQAWYLSDDFRTLMVLPVYVFLMAKSALIGYSAIFGTFAYSSVKLVQILRDADIDYKILLKLHPHAYAIMVDRLHNVYTDSAVRMSTYLLGATVGHLLYLYETGRIKQWPAWFRKWGMKAALCMGASFFFGAQLLASPMINQFLPHRDDIDSNTVVLLIPLFKSAMEFSICVMILLLITGGGYSIISRILSGQAMKILASISYAVFLIHVEIMYKLPTQLFESDWWQLVIHAVFFIVISNVVALLIHLLYEIPIQNMTRYLFKKAIKLVN